MIYRMVHRKDQRFSPLKSCKVFCIRGAAFFLNALAGKQNKFKTNELQTKMVPSKKVDLATSNKNYQRKFMISKSCAGKNLVTSMNLICMIGVTFFCCGKVISDPWTLIFHESKPYNLQFR